MNLFGAFADAFKNDDTLGERENAGLKKGANFKTVTWVGPNGQKKEVSGLHHESACCSALMHDMYPRRHKLYLGRVCGILREAQAFELGMTAMKAPVRRARPWWVVAAQEYVLRECPIRTSTSNTT